MKEVSDHCDLINQITFIILRLCGSQCYDRSSRDTISSFRPFSGMFLFATHATIPVVSPFRPSYQVYLDDAECWFIVRYRHGINLFRVRFIYSRRVYIAVLLFVVGRPVSSIQTYEPQLKLLPLWHFVHVYM